MAPMSYTINGDIFRLFPILFSFAFLGAEIGDFERRKALLKTLKM